jgi:hypothetical protein
MTNITLPDGRTHGIKGLYLEAIRSNRSNGAAYHHLGAALGAAEVVTLLDGRKLNEQQLYLEALRLYPARCDVLRSLANTLTTRATVTLPDGRTVNKRQLRAAAARSSGVPTTGNVPRRRARQRRAPEDVRESRKDESTMAAAEHKRHAHRNESGGRAHDM